MAITCNISRQGRLFRAASGLVFVVLGVALIVRSWPPAWWQWLIGIALVLVGLFQIFEASVGWCGVRALGWRTPI